MTGRFPIIFLVVLIIHGVLFLVLRFTSPDSVSEIIPATSMKVVIGEISAPKLASLPKKDPPKPKAAPAAPVEENTVEAKDTATEAPPETALSGRVQADLRSMYQAELRARIDANKFYPLISRRLGQKGTVVVEFRLHQDGTITGLRVVNSSRHDRLDDAALEAVRKVGRMRPIPPELGESSMDITVPVKFTEI